MKARSIDDLPKPPPGFMWREKKPAKPKSKRKVDPRFRHYAKNLEKK